MVPETIKRLSSVSAAGAANIEAAGGSARPPAAVALVAFNEVFAFRYAIGDRAIANRRGGADIDYLGSEQSALRTTPECSMRQLSLAAVVSGYDAVAAQTVHARKTVRSFRHSVRAFLRRCTARRRTARSGSITAGFTMLCRDGLKLSATANFMDTSCERAN
jgi:hypothetical protein